jgi:hypothetical protein
MQFRSTDELHCYLDEYVKPLGFRVRHDPHNDAQLGLVKGSFQCWCYQKPRAKPNGSDAKVYHADQGKVNCGCQWKVSYRKTSSDVLLAIKQVSDKHTGHFLPVQPATTAVSDKARHVRTQEDVTQEMIDMMRELISYSQPGRAWTQEHLSGRFNVSFDDHVFRNLFRSLISHVTYQPNEQDWRDAVKWGRALGEAALVAVDMDASTCQGRRLLFMSPPMTYNFHRNCEVLSMDTTHGTNRYRFHLLLVVGVSHYGHTAILAAALLRNQQQDDFIWALSQIKAFVGSDTWDRIKSVFSDGDAAMKIAVDAIMPRAAHLRCVWHVQRNIADKCTTWLGKGADDEVLNAFQAAANKIIFASSEQAAQKAVNDLYSAYPDPSCRSYFDDYILPNLSMFVSYQLRQKVTFGMQSTQRSESVHSLIKRDGLAYKPLTINTTALELLTILHNVAERHEKAAVEVDARALQKSRERPASQGPGGNCRPGQSLHSRVIDVLTKYASDFMNEHFQAISNYTLEEVDFTEDDGIEEWRCINRDHPTSVHVVTINRVPDPDLSNIMVCTCELPSNYQLPCTHVMAVNQLVFQQPVIFAQVGQRWRRAWQPSSFQPRQQPMNFFSADSQVLDGVGAEEEFDQPEDETERKVVAWEMSRDEMYAAMDELMECSRDRPAIMDIIREFMRELKTTVNRRLIGDYSNSTALSRHVLGSGASGDTGDRLRNPLPRDTSKRQKRYLGRSESGGRSNTVLSQAPVLPKPPTSAMTQ